MLFQVRPQEVVKPVVVQFLMKFVIGLEMGISPSAGVYPDFLFAFGYGADHQYPSTTKTPVYAVVLSGAVIVSAVVDTETVKPVVFEVTAAMTPNWL